MAHRVQSLTRNKRQSEPKIAKLKLDLYNFCQCFLTIRDIVMFIATVNLRVISSEK